LRTIDVEEHPTFPLAVAKLYGDRSFEAVKVKAKMEGLSPDGMGEVAPGALKAMARWAFGAGLLVEASGGDGA
jgi:hypothetical protein